MIKKITNFIFAYLIVFLMCFASLSFVSSSHSGNNNGIGNSKVENDNDVKNYNSDYTSVKSKASSGDSAVSFSEGSDDIISVEYPAAASTSDKEERSIHALWGGINNNTTEEHKLLQHQAQMAQSLYQAKASFLLSKLKNLDRTLPEEEVLAAKKDIIVSLEIAKQEYIIALQSAYDQIVRSNEPGKFLGLFKWNNRSCNALNACKLFVIK